MNGRSGMTSDEINNLLVSAESSGHESFWAYSGKFFMLFYDRFKGTPFIDIPDAAFVYMEINNWQGMSARCGAWQYYESGAFQDGKFERVLSFLKTNGEEEMAAVYACGIHDYANEKYRESYDYPKEWFDEADKIDQWINDNEDDLYKWMYHLIVNHKSELLKLGEK